MAAPVGRPLSGGKPTHEIASYFPKRAAPPGWIAPRRSRRVATDKPIGPEGAPMLYVISCTDKPDHGAVRQENRPAHLDYLKSHGATLRLAGPMTLNTTARTVNTATNCMTCSIGAITNSPPR